MCDVATAVALRGACLADLAVVHAQPEIFGPVASDPTVSRLVSTQTADIDVVLPAIRSAQARAAVWTRRRPLAGRAGSREGGLVVVDIDATLITAHSDKVNAADTLSGGSGSRRLCAFVDHGEYILGQSRENLQHRVRADGGRG